MYGYWELNTGLLQEQNALFFAKLSLQSPLFLDSEESVSLLETLLSVVVPHYSCKSLELALANIDLQTAHLITDPQGHSRWDQIINTQYNN